MRWISRGYFVIHGDTTVHKPSAIHEPSAIHGPFAVSGFATVYRHTVLPGYAVISGLAMVPGLATVPRHAGLTGGRSSQAHAVIYTATSLLTGKLRFMSPLWFLDLLWLPDSLRFLDSCSSRTCRDPREHRYLQGHCDSLGRAAAHRYTVVPGLAMVHRGTGGSRTCHGKHGS